MDNSIDMNNPYAPSHYRATSYSSMNDKSTGDYAYNCRKEQYMNTIQPNHCDKDSTERGGSQAPKSRREIFEQQRENFRRKSREMRKSVEKCKENEVASKLCTIAHKEPVLAFHTRNKDLEISKQLSWMNTEKSGIKINDKHTKIIEAGQNGKSLFLENLAQSEVQRKAQAQQNNAEEVKNEIPGKKKKSKKRKSSSKKSKRANSTVNQEEQQNVNVVPQQFGKLFDESLQLKKAVSHVNKEEPKDQARKDSSKKLNIKKKNKANVDEEITEKENKIAEQPKAKRRSSRKIGHHVGEELNSKSKGFTGMRSIIDDLESSINQIFAQKTGEEPEKPEQEINETNEENSENQKSISEDENECYYKVEDLQNTEQVDLNLTEGNEACDQKEEDSTLNKNLQSDSTERDEEAHSNESSEQSQTAQAKFLSEISDPNIELSQKIEMLKRAVPKEAGLLNLTIVRKKSGLSRFAPKFYLYDESKTTFLLNSKKKVANQTSNYLISLEEGAFSKESYTFIGKVRSNHKKNKYIIYDNGENIEKNKKADPTQARCELGYVSLLQGKKNLPGHRALEYIIPEVDEIGIPFTFQPKTSKESIVEKYTGISAENMIVFENQVPYWNDEKQAYVMMFTDRVKESSVKNFQLKRKVGEIATKEDEIFLEFGRINKTDFCLTLKWPFSILNAFGLALSSFDL